jgi:hypothetical protein
MNNDDIQPTTFERLPVRIFLKVFATLSLQEIITAFWDLNSHINSIIHYVKNGNHTVTNDDTKAVDLLHLFPTIICRLIIMNSPNVDFTLLLNLRSLTIKYGSVTQFNVVRPEHFRMLEILHIHGGKSRKSVMKCSQTMRFLKQKKKVIMTFSWIL